MYCIWVPDMYLYIINRKNKEFYPKKTFSDLRGKSIFFIDKI